MPNLARCRVEASSYEAAGIVPSRWELVVAGNTDRQSLNHFTISNDGVSRTNGSMPKAVVHHGTIGADTMENSRLLTQSRERRSLC